MRGRKLWVKHSSRIPREPLITAALHDDLLAYLGGIVRELKRLDRPVKNRIVSAITALASDPRPLGCFSELLPR